MTKKRTSSPFPDDIKSKLKMFLGNNWVGNTPEELACAWNTQSVYCVDEEEIRDVLGSMGLLVSELEIERITILKRKELEIMLSGSVSIMEKIRAERVELIKSRLEEMKDIWTGLESEEAAAEKPRPIEVNI